MAPDSIHTFLLLPDKQTRRCLRRREFPSVYSHSAAPLVNQCVRFVFVISETTAPICLLRHRCVLSGDVEALNNNLKK